MPHFGNNFAIEAQQVIYAGGAISSGIRLAELEQQLAKLDWQKNRQEIRFLLAGHYLDLYKLYNQAQVLQKNLELTEQMIAHMEARRREGTVLQNDITRYELQRETLKLQLAKVQDAAKILNHRLVTTLHLPEGTEITPDTTLLEHQVQTLAEDDWQALATQNNLSVNDAGIAEVRVQLENARRELERYKKLLAEDAVTRQQYDNIATAYEATKARYEQVSRVKHSTSLTKNEQTHRLGQNEAAVRLAQAAVELARLNLSYTVITATCDGVTGRKDIHEGQLVQPGQTMVDIVDGTDLWVIANYRETQLPNIHEGDRVTLTADAVPGITYTGTVESISDATGAAFSLIPQDNATGNFVKVEQRVPVRISLAGNDPERLKLLRAGFNVECKVKH